MKNHLHVKRFKHGAFAAILTVLSSLAWAVPPEAVNACSSLSESSSCRFQAPDGNTISGVCALIEAELACAPGDGTPPPNDSGNGTQPPPKDSGNGTPPPPNDSGNGTPPPPNDSGNTPLPLNDSGEGTPPPPKDSGNGTQPPPNDSGEGTKPRDDRSQTNSGTVSQSDYAYFDNNTLYLPETDAATLGTYYLTLSLSVLEPITFDLNNAALVSATGNPDAVYNPDTGTLNIPAVLVGTEWWNIQFQLVSESGVYRFEITNMEAGQAPTDSDNTGNTPGNTTLVDTNQNDCYNANGSTITCPAEGEDFYGQDAQFTGNIPSYTDNNDGTITDNMTDLMWQQSPDTDGDGDIDAADKLSYTQAQSYCENLSQAGHTDWVLPDIKQLYSLIDFNGTDPSGYNGNDTSGFSPFIDTNYFNFAYGDTSAGERIIDSQYASSTLYVSNTSEELLFGVNFADGRIKGYGLRIRGQDKTFFVSCVRQNANYGQNDFADNGNGTVTDNATGMMWAQNDSGEGLNWQESLAYCSELNDAGYDDWQLPDVKELQSIVDYSRSPDTTNSAAIDPLFSVTAITNEAGQTDYPAYWSSTTHANYVNGKNAAYLNFGRAMGYMNGSWRDVHGAGAQRSDPKAGDPANYPTGKGPQGDAIRIYNYARCVRAGVN